MKGKTDRNVMSLQLRRKLMAGAKRRDGRSGAHEDLMMEGTTSAEKDPIGSYDATSELETTQIHDAAIL